METNVGCRRRLEVLSEMRLSVIIISMENADLNESEGVLLERDGSQRVPEGSCVLLGQLCYLCRGNAQSGKRPSP